MAQNYATSFNPVNYSGLLFEKNRVETPMLSLMRGRRVFTNAVEFATNQDYEIGGGTQPSISESASLVAPNFTPTERTQATNVTQIYQRTFGVSWAKTSNMGTLQGLNNAGQTANPNVELAFQSRVQLDEMAKDMNYTIINGVYQKATSDTTVNRSRGFSTAITTHVMDLSGAEVGYWDVVMLLKEMSDAGVPTNNLTVLLRSTTLLQINKDAIANDMSATERSRTVNGIDINTLVTPFGNINFVIDSMVAEGEMLFLNLSVARLVEQPVVDAAGLGFSGNFFLSRLGLVGAGVRFQIFGQMGLDHGPEWMHGKITGIAPDFEPPTQEASSVNP